MTVHKREKIVQCIGECKAMWDHKGRKLFKIATRRQKLQVRIETTKEAKSQLQLLSAFSCWSCFMLCRTLYIKLFKAREH